MTLAKEPLRQSAKDGWMTDTWGVLLARSNRSKRDSRNSFVGTSANLSAHRRRVATGLTREDSGREICERHFVGDVQILAMSQGRNQAWLGRLKAALNCKQRGSTAEPQAERSLHSRSFIGCG